MLLCVIIGVIFECFYFVCTIIGVICGCCYCLCAVVGVIFGYDYLDPYVQLKWPFGPYSDNKKQVLEP